MPVFNASAYIRSAIESVLTQTYTHWELIIINDGSTDDSELKIKLFFDERIQYVFQLNGGVSSARNAGLRLMRGQYFCFLDADDVLPVNSLQSRLNIFTNEIDFVDGAVTVYDETLTQPISHWIPQITGQVVKSLIRLDGKCFFGPTWMVKRKPSINYIMDETLRYGEDLVFYISLAKHGNYSYTTDTILYYRKNASSAMRNIRGLANGYRAMNDILWNQFRSDFGYWSRFVFSLKTRKIIFLEFLSRREFKFAMNYLVRGKV